MNVAKSDLYSINVDNDINRIYIICKGAWNNINDISSLGKDLEKAVELLDEGFTCCTDMSDLESASADCHSELSYTKIVLIQKGITKEAFVMTEGEALIINFNTGKTNFQGKTFRSLKEAENWLNLN